MQVPKDWIENIEHFSGAVVTAFVAILGKICNEILMKRSLTWLAWCAVIGVSLFWAWMAGLFCAWMNYSYISTSLVVGISTLMGEKINIYLIFNYRQILDKILSLFLTKK